MSATETEPGTDAAARVVGALMRDTRRNRVGEFRGEEGGRVFLRPVGGGCEWQARPDQVQPADRNDELRARVRELNQASRQGRL